MELMHFNYFRNWLNLFSSQRDDEFFSEFHQFYFRRSYFLKKKIWALHMCIHLHIHIHTHTHTHTHIYIYNIKFLCHSFCYHIPPKRLARFWGNFICIFGRAENRFLSIFHAPFGLHRPSGGQKLCFYIFLRFSMKKYIFKWFLLQNI